MTREEFARFLEKLRKADEKGEDTDAIVNPFIPGDLGYRNSEPDLLLTNDRDDAAPRDRISIEIQHDGDTIYKHRVVLYVSRHISNMVKKNAPPVLENLNLISFSSLTRFRGTIPRIIAIRCNFITRKNRFISSRS